MMAKTRLMEFSISKVRLAVAGILMLAVLAITNYYT